MYMGADTDRDVGGGVLAAIYPTVPTAAVRIYLI
jgi:phosphoserine aminotransferase